MRRSISVLCSLWLWSLSETRFMTGVKTSFVKTTLRLYPGMEWILRATDEKMGFGACRKRCVIPEFREKDLFGYLIRYPVDNATTYCFDRFIDSIVADDIFFYVDSSNSKEECIHQRNSKHTFYHILLFKKLHWEKILYLVQFKNNCKPQFLNTINRVVHLCVFSLLWLY